ncbi:MAG: barstar family protein [Acutalibacteraceae bacterium]
MENENKKVIKLDLTGCKHSDEIHERIRKAFDFPEWYGKNWDAFWDLLWSECDDDKLNIYGEYTLPKSLKKSIESMHGFLKTIKEKDKSTMKHLILK